MNIRRSSFTPAWWLPGAHLQTIVPSRLRPFRPPPRIRQRLLLPDRDFVDLDWVGQEFAHAPLVLILHGLTGSADSQYTWGLQQALLDRRWTSVVLNFRGCSGEPNRLPRAYHSGETQDLHEVVRHLQTQPAYADRPLATVGYSLGGNVLLKWLGEQGESAPVRAAVAVSVPYDLASCQRKLDRGFARIYRNHLLGNLRDAALDKRRHFHVSGSTEHLESLERLGDVESIQTLWEFDERITAPLHGFSGAEDYYRRSSSRPWLHHIRAPTLLLHAEDDPMVDASSIPSADELAPGTVLELSQHGGHVGFVAGSTPLRPEYWLEKRIPEYLAGHFDTGTPA